jgi:hypothetical protein
MDYYSAFGIPQSALVFRLLRVLLLVPTIATGVSAQAVPRADTPLRRSVRVTFDPMVETWDERFWNGRRERLGAPLTGDTVGGTYLPLVARLQQDVRTAAALPGFTASLGRGLFSVLQQRRTTAITAEVGLSNRLSVGVTFPLVRVFTRVGLRLDTAGASLGLNPLITDPANASSYQAFFSQFDGVLSQLQQNIDGGSYGCPTSPQCAQARAFLSEARGVRDALNRSVYGSGTAGGAPFLPRTTSDGGLGIDSNVVRIQQELNSTWGVPGFVETFLLPADPLDGATFASALADTLYGFGMRPFVSTRPLYRFWLGDAEVAARYRLVARPSYSATVGALVRLPTGHLDSPHDALDIPTGDGQTDVEAHLVQELVVLGRLWLNLSLRAGFQRPGEADRRVAPVWAFLAPRGATARLGWDPGDYVAADFAPLYRFSERFGVGVTAGYITRTEDRYTFLTPQDSMDLATRLGVATPASVLDAGTGVVRVRTGVAATYAGPTLEGGFSLERTTSVRGGPLAAATVFRIILRTSRKLF